MLFRVSMDLSTMQDDQLAPVSILKLLNNVNLLDWPELLPSSTPSTVNRMESLQSMTDFYTEVHDAADLIGHSMIITVERFVNPHVCVPPITLSATEHTRLACTL